MRSTSRVLPLAFTALILLCAACGTGEPPAPATAPAHVELRPVVLATTTSTADTGLLDVLVPLFEKGSGLRIKAVAVGTGQALELGRRGEADVLLVHAPEQELEFIAAGHGKRHRAVMHNDFVIVGPATDPAGIAGGREAAGAMARIAAGGHPWISRGDESGTHTKERALWKSAGAQLAGGWYVETGQGMGATLRVASERQAYTLSDRSTFLATANLDLAVAVEGDAGLGNYYHVIEVVGPKVNAAGAAAVADFLVSQEAQTAIGAFDVRGQRLFFPDAVK
ncbi:MAG TPA: substrate-binding domain-containing protein [Polyangia bacterium]|nr:substrate-binding domain-containing protein [Polyangia bacterium]